MRRDDIATSPSSPTSTTARRRWSIACCARAASSATRSWSASRFSTRNDLERERGITILAKNIAHPLPGREDQHHRHARPRRFRRRGGAGAADGRRGAGAGRRRRGPDAADPVRALQGVRVPAAADRGDQQDRPARRPAARGARRGASTCSCELGADDELADFPYIFASAQATATPRPIPASRGDSIQPLMDLILGDGPGPGRRRRRRRCRCWSPRSTGPTTSAASPSAASQSGTIRKGQSVALMQADDRSDARQGRLGLRLREPGPRARSHEVDAGDIVAVVGLEGVEIGDTICRPANARGPAAADGRRADAADDLRRQHLAAGRPRGQVSHQPPPPRAAAAASWSRTSPCASSRSPAPSSSRSPAAACCTSPC